MDIGRRKFIKGMAAASVTIPVINIFDKEKTNSEKNAYPVSFFTKSLDEFEPDFMIETLAEAGLDGLDLTVRPKGRVEPKLINKELPEIIETGRKNGLKTEMIVTSIKSVDDINTKTLLRTAAKLGIKHYRLGYYSYNFQNGMEESLNQIKNELLKLESLNKKYNIQAGYQNHSGVHFGAPMWDLWNVIKNISSDFISSQFDIRHAVTEGASSWILALHLLKKNIGSFVVKDFTWDVSSGRGRVKSVPLGEGIIDFDLFFKTISEQKIKAPITLHIEYPVISKEEEKLSLIQKQKIIIKKIKKDVDFIHSFINKYQLA